MAAVTENAKPTTNVNGNQRELYFNTITVVTTGDTLFVPLRTVNEMESNDPAGITKMAATAAAGGSTITFTGTAANLVFKVTGV